MRVILEGTPSEIMQLLGGTNKHASIVTGTPQMNLSDLTPDDFGKIAEDLKNLDSVIIDSMREELCKPGLGSPKTKPKGSSGLGKLKVVEDGSGSLKVVEDEVGDVPGYRRPRMVDVFDNADGKGLKLIGSYKSVAEAAVSIGKTSANIHAAVDRDTLYLGRYKFITRRMKDEKTEEIETEDFDS